MTTLIAAKFHQPVSRTKLVQRLQLIQRLNAGLNAGQQVFLVSAPAGFGKTTCINEWVNTLDGWMVSWLTLDTEDDDPGRFFTYIIAALQRVNGKLGQDIESVLRSGQLPPGEIISTILINDILELKEPFLLVLDDFHIIQDPFILEVFKKLMAHLPQPLRLCLITREDPPLPLAKLRANNLLTEIRARDLRFDGHDIELFLNNVIGLSLTQADIAALEVKTEGWIVGLQLAGLSMREQEDTSDFISTLSGSHRYILSYLTEQVLGQQTEEIQRFLLQTSILNKLNGDLCDAVTRHRDSHALLEKLLAANLFKAYSYSAELVDLHTHAPPIVLQIGERPFVSPVTRMQATKGDTLAPNEILAELKDSEQVERLKRVARRLARRGVQTQLYSE